MDLRSLNIQCHKLKDLKWLLILPDGNSIKEIESGHWSKISEKEILKDGEVLRVYSNPWNKIKLVIEETEMLSIDNEGSDKVFFRRKMAQPAFLTTGYMVSAEIGIIKNNRIILYKFDLFEKVTVSEKSYDRN